MFRLFFLALAVGAYFFRLQSRSASRRAQQSTRVRAGHLAQGNFENLVDELDLPVRQKPAAGFSVEILEASLKELREKQLTDKFRLLDLRRGSDSDLIVLADGKTSELVPTRHGNELVDRFYSCCIYVHPLPEEDKVSFRSAFPDDKEHQYLLEDFADLLYQRGLADGNV
jgi:hypothetical protein